jgi:hypothetical protein
MASVIGDRLPELVRNLWYFVSRMYNESGKIASPQPLRGITCRRIGDGALTFFPAG